MCCTKCHLVSAACFILISIHSELFDWCIFRQELSVFSDVVRIVLWLNSNIHGTLNHLYVEKHVDSCKKSNIAPNSCSELYKLLAGCVVNYIYEVLSVQFNCSSQVFVSVSEVCWIPEQGSVKEILTDFYTFCYCNFVSFNILLCCQLRWLLH